MLAIINKKWLFFWFHIISNQTEVSTHLLIFKHCHFTHNSVHIICMLQTYVTHIHIHMTHTETYCEK